MDTPETLMWRNPMPVVRRLRGREELERLMAAARADKHCCVAPTHVVEKGGELVGYWSVGGMPTVHLWHDSQRMTARDSLVMLGTLRTVCEERGFTGVIVPVADTSPYLGLMEKAGFTVLGRTNLTFMNLQQAKGGQ